MFFKKFKLSLERGHSKFNSKLIPEKRLVRKKDGEFYLTTKYVRVDKDIQNVLDKHPKLIDKYEEYLNKYDYILNDNFHNLQYLSKFLTLDSFSKSSSSSLYKQINMFNDENTSALSILESSKYKENKDLLKDIFGFSVLFTGLKGIFPELREKHLSDLLNDKNFLNNLLIEMLYFEVEPKTGYMYLSTDLKYKYTKLSRSINISHLDKFIGLKNTFIATKDNKPISAENILFYQVSLMELLKDVYKLNNFNIITKAETSLYEKFIGAGIWLRKGYSLSNVDDLTTIYTNLSELAVNEFLPLSELFINFDGFGILIDMIKDFSIEKNKNDFSARDNFELFNELINFEFKFYDKSDINYLFTYLNDLIDYYDDGDESFINKMKNILSVMKDRAINENKVRLFDLLKFIDSEYVARITDKNEFILNLLAREKL